MIQRRTILFHVLSWVLFTGAVIAGEWLDQSAGKPADPAKALVHCIGLISTFYFVYSFVCPFTLRRTRLVAFVPLLLLASPTVYMSIVGIFAPMDDFVNTGRSAVNALSVSIVAAAVYSMEEAFRREKESRQLKAQMAEAELSFLRAQVNPHFLYNTLNYFYYLARPASTELADAVVRLSDLMRFTLAETADGRIRLEDEITHIRNYIHLIRLRFHPQFHVSLEVEGTPENVEVPALLFIPFVENAIKHGTVTDPDHPVEINFRLQDDTIHFSCSNLVNTGNKPPSSGVGLRNVRRRLELLYPNSHQLNLTDTREVFSVELIIHLQNNPL